MVQGAHGEGAYGRGLGKITIGTISSFVELVCKVGGSLLLSHLFGYVGIWHAAPIGWVLGVIPSMIYYYSGKWIPKEEKKAPQA